MMDRHTAAGLDAYITGNGGEDQFADDEEAEPMERDAIEERISVAEDIIEHMAEIARLVRSIGDPQLRAYCLAAFEGREGGWRLGTFERDIVERYITAQREALGELDAG